VGKPLGYRLEGYYSARRGQDRVIYKILETEVVVEVVNISHRSDVY
jgi:mRNA interferase RelE/StbE